MGPKLAPKHEKVKATISKFWCEIYHSIQPLLWPIFQSFPEFFRRITVPHPLNSRTDLFTIHLCEIRYQIKKIFLWSFHIENRRYLCFIPYLIINRMLRNVLPFPDSTSLTLARNIGIYGRKCSTTLTVSASWQARV